MNSPRTFFLLLLALLVSCIGLAAHLQPQFQGWRGSRASGDIFNVVLGDSRRLFANQFYVKADAYYHSGYYPSMFDDNDAFGRNFFPDRHTHLDGGGPADNLGGSDEVREILPWLKLSADLDPDNVQTYTVTAFWLRERMNNVKEADAMLHEGLRNCPDSYDILFELGRLYSESYHDQERARNVWELGVRKWRKIYPTLDPEAQKENRLIMEQLTTHLAKLEEDTGNLPQAIDWFQAAQKVSLTPDAIQQQVNRLKFKLGQEFNPLLKPLY